MTTWMDIAFSPAVKDVQSRRGSRQAYARVEAKGSDGLRSMTASPASSRPCGPAILATASRDGQPYIQHRGGPAGFLRVLDGATLGFADLAGNRQYISTGNLAENPKAMLFLKDYATRHRVKIWGTARWSRTPTGLDFTGTPKPSGKFQITTLIEGTGDPLAKGQTAYVNYLGQVYNGAKPFDESYTTGQPFSFAVGGGQVIKGWDQGLQGVTVGSRVIVQIPPSWGYGAQGQSGAGIKGTDTLYFVVDVLGAA